MLRHAFFCEWNQPVCLLFISGFLSALVIQRRQRRKVPRTTHRIGCAALPKLAPVLVFLGCSPSCDRLNYSYPTSFLNCHASIRLRSAAFRSVPSFFFILLVSSSLSLSLSLSLFVCLFQFFPSLSLFCAGLDQRWHPFGGSRRRVARIFVLACEGLCRFVARRESSTGCCSRVKSGGFVPPKRTRC